MSIYFDLFFFMLQMNKLTAREIFKGGHYSFELHRTDHQSEDVNSSIVVVQFESEIERNEWLKCINGQIKYLKQIANSLSNPFS